MKIYIKYMVSIRCKLVVKAELEKMGIEYSGVELGEAVLINDLTSEEHDILKIALFRSGLELMDDKKAMLIEKIKNIIIEMVHYSDEPLRINFSDFLSEKLCQEYTYLSHLFSQATGITIEHYIIAQKIERIKELLLYDELNLTEISYLLNYSSVAHLSTQFKKETGLTPSFFKNLKQHKRRIMLEDL
jgi:AraC-like DNA-binding protein